ncbi:DUF2283 domain-containing protein [Tautonia marina]|uniref:DUF2283 domain-containing protein n=1 Tax=Tautonia marina TaxID=2653855 RepID=UPI001260948E|nr:DUF2283 domain-containing protein [Tautonia marina]
MNQPYLEVTFRRGKPIAAYLYLPRRPGDRAVRSEPVDDLIVIDRAEDGRPIGLELVDPVAVSADRVNAVLRQLDQPELAASELAPLHAA